jgi:Ca2+-binding RTX toxin-like protein
VSFVPGGASSANLSTTQISSPTITIVSSGNALPTATILGNGGRTIPTSVIEDDVTGNVETSGVFDPATDGIDFYESLEGMLVQINNPLATSPTATFGTSQEIWVLADNGANATSRTARGGSLINASDFNPERIQIDDLNNALVLPEVNVGAQLSTITGVVNYDFSNYEVLVSMAPTIVQASPLQKEITNLAGSANDLTIANFNVENLDPVVEDINKVDRRNPNNVDDDLGTGKFDALAQAIVNNLKTPDIISLEEIQDNTGAEIGDGVVASDVTLNLLIDRIVAAGGPRYEFQVLNPVEGQDGGQPGGNIRVGFLFNPNRVNFVEGSLQRLTDTNPVESDSFPGDDFASSRKPLVGTFQFNGQAVTIVANHFNSKGGDQPLFGRFQPPTLTSEAQRLQQAAIVKDFVQSVLAANPNANVVVAGDLNDFEFSTPVNLVESAGLVNLIETLPANERYSYNFEGNAQTLDHMLVSSNLFKQLDGFDVVHFNSEFADQISDHDPSVARFRFNSAPTALALSTTSINENVPANTLIGNFTTTDPDPGNTFTYSLVAGAGDSGNIAFTVNSNQLQINLSPDFEMNSSYSIRVRTTDQGGLSLDSILTIAINDINEIFGDSGNNTIQGTTGVDTIFGRAGNDNLFGNGGNDIIFGEDGNDKLLGGFGNDYLDGGNGNDIIADVGGKNTIFGGAGNDTIMVGLGASLIDGGAGNDTIYLLFGEDTIVLTRGNGNDTINNYNAGSTRFNLTGGLTFNDLTIAQDGSSTLIRAGGEKLASLAGVQASSVTANSFLTA